MSDETKGNVPPALWPSDRDHSGKRFWDAPGRLYKSLTFSYMNPILQKGARQFHANHDHLTMNDLYQAPNDLQAEQLAKQFW